MKNQTNKKNLLLRQIPKQKQEKRGRIAFITTPKYRQAHPEAVKDFVFRHLYSLCISFEVKSTGGTYDFIMDLLEKPLSAQDLENISQDMGIRKITDEIFSLWCQTIRSELVRKLRGIQGMIELTYDLVEGRLDAVIHLTDWDDVIGKPDSMALRREANVHNIYIASDIHSARGAASTWKSLSAKDDPIFTPRDEQKHSPLQGLTTDHRVLGLISHDGKKLDMCKFVVEYSREIFSRFDFILATGTTGHWLQQFIKASGRSNDDVNKIRRCLSGPYGGDIQIAAAVVKKLCRKIIFFQDPFSSHAHGPDISLFEQAVLTDDINVELATNIDSAKIVLLG